MCAWGVSVYQSVCLCLSVCLCVSVCLCMLTCVSVSSITVSPTFHHLSKVMSAMKVDSPRYKSIQNANRAQKTLRAKLLLAYNPSVLIVFQQDVLNNLLFTDVSAYCFCCSIPDSSQTRIWSVFARLFVAAGSNS